MGAHHALELARGVVDALRPGVHQFEGFSVDVDGGPGVAVDGLPGFVPGALARVINLGLYFGFLQAALDAAEVRYRTRAA